MRLTFNKKGNYFHVKHAKITLIGFSQTYSKFDFDFMTFHDLDPTEIQSSAERDNPFQLGKTSG